MSVSIFCIQLSPTIRLPSFTKGSKPQKVTKTRQRTPLAAAVDDRIRTGQILSRSPDQSTITSSLVFTGVVSSGAGAASGQPSTSAIAVASGSSGGNTVRSSVGVVMVIASLPAQDEAEHAAVRGLLDELVAGRARPGREVLDRSGIGGEDLDPCAGRHRLDGLGGLHDRHGAGQASS